MNEQRYGRGSVRGKHGYYTAGPVFSLLWCPRGLRASEVTLGTLPSSCSLWQWGLLGAKDKPLGWTLPQAGQGQTLL